MGEGQRGEALSWAVGQADPAPARPGSQAVCVRQHSEASRGRGSSPLHPSPLAVSPGAVPACPPLRTGWQPPVGSGCPGLRTPAALREGCPLATARYTGAGKSGRGPQEGAGGRPPSPRAATSGSLCLRREREATAGARCWLGGRYRRCAFNFVSLSALGAVLSYRV